MNQSATLPAAIEAELQGQVARVDTPRGHDFHAMLTYHMGWTGGGAGPEASGKRIRPLLALLTTAACGADWRPALPAAAAIELVHSFSLVHDDIQDRSEKRRGRPAVWVKWGTPMAINVGDALLMLSSLAMLDLAADFPAETVSAATAILCSASLRLAEGQFMDMSYESRKDLKVEDYWPMVAGDRRIALPPAIWAHCSVERTRANRIPIVRLETIWGWHFKSRMTCLAFGATRPSPESLLSVI
jgi:geranylgeranyl diphosphate synthase type I